MSFICYWRPDQVERLLYALLSLHHFEAHAAALFMWRAGLQLSEVVNPDYLELDLTGEQGQLRVFPPSSRRPSRVVPLHPELVQFIGSRGLLPLGFISGRSVSRHLRRGFEVSGLDMERIDGGKRLPGAASLRHSAAVHWLVSGVPLPIVSRWLGHSSMEVTFRTYISGGWPGWVHDWNMESIQ